MDDIERAQEREQLDRAIAIAAVARHSAPTLQACGECYNCGTSLPPAVCFCDKDCTDDYSARKAAEVRQGIRAQ